jgi:acetate kinase
LKILVVNAGSSSLKYQLFNMENQTVLAKGICECIGNGGKLIHKHPDMTDYHIDTELPTHDEAINLVLKILVSPEYGVIKSVSEIDAVGHRIAHGGESYKKSTILNEDVISDLETLNPINPLHGPPIIRGMKACIKHMKDTPQVGVFDTSYYSDIEDYRYIYPLPYELYTEKKIRRYGFHGTSHRYVTERVAGFMGRKLEDLKIITCHLGNGSSITATSEGKAVDTSMGFTPQEGVMMGTRCGSIDPTILPYLIKSEGYAPEQLEEIINKKSGFLGVSGVSNDTREVTVAAKNGNKRAALSINIFVNGIKKYIGGYAAEMNGLDVLVFTAGIGENDANIRSLVCRNMDFLGIKIDEERNLNFKRGEEFEITAEGAGVRTFIIPTNEELMIAMDTKKLVAKG